MVVQDTSFAELHKVINLSRLWQYDLFASKCNDVFGESGFEYVQRLGFPVFFLDAFLVKPFIDASID